MKFSEQLKSGVILDNPVFMADDRSLPDAGNHYFSAECDWHGRGGYRRSHLLQYRYFRDAQNYPG